MKMDKKKTDEDSRLGVLHRVFGWKFEKKEKKKKQVKWQRLGISLCQNRSIGNNKLET